MAGTLSQPRIRALIRMASPTPGADAVLALLEDAKDAVAQSEQVRAGYRRRSDPGDPVRRQSLNMSLDRLKSVAEDLRRERIRAARDRQFRTLWGNALEDASRAVKRARYSTYRMLNPGGHRWTHSA